MNAVPGQPRRRRALGCLIALLVIVALAVALAAIFAGSAQRAVVRAAIASILHAKVEMDHASLLGGIDLQGLRIAQRGTDADQPPAIAADTIDITYTLFPDNGRYVDAFEAEGLRVALLRDADGQRNFAYLIDYLTAPAEEEESMALIPRRIALDPMEIHAGAPGWELLLGGLTVSGVLDSEIQTTLRVEAPEVTGQWRLEGVVEESPLAGAIHLALERNGGDVVVDGKINLEALASVDANAAVTLAENSTTFDLNVREANFTQGLWGRLIRDLAGVPLQFDSLDVSGASVKGALTDDVLRLDAASLRGEARGVVLGDDTQTYYQGDAVLALSGSLGGEEDVFTAELELNPGGALKVETSGPPGALRATIETGTWEIEAMRAALPEAYREQLELWPALAAIQLQGDVSRVDETLSGNLTITPSLRAEGGNAPTIQTEWRVDLNEEDATQSAYSLMLMAKAEGSARVELAGAGTALGETSIHLEKTPLDAWYRMWQGTPLGVDATVTGDIQAGPVSGEAWPIDFKLDGNLRGVGEKPVAFNASGQTRYSTSAATAEALGVALTLGDIGKIDLTKAQVNTKPQTASGAVNADLDLDAAGTAFGMPDLHGAMTLKASLGWDGNTVQLKDLTAVGDTLGYGDLFLPYGTESTLTSDLGYDAAAGKITLAPLDLALMDGTRMQSPKLGLTLGDASAITADALMIETDLALLVSREILAGADAQLTVNLTDLNAAADHARARVDAALSAESLILANTLSVLRGVEAKLNFAYDDGMDGGGTLSVEEVEAAGTTIRAMSSDVVCQGETITLEGLRTILFDGDVTATVNANLGGETLAADIKAAVEQIDLKVFTEEFEPPQVKLTGKVHGTVTAVLTPSGITAMEVDLESTEGFSLNREIVEDLLKSQEGGAMSDRVMNKVMNKMLGDEPQRPFDRAALTLNLQDDGRIGGEARLESSDLNLTVAIAADPEAILAALRARQE